MPNFSDFEVRVKLVYGFGRKSRGISVPACGAGGWMCAYEFLEFLGFWVCSG